LCVAFTLFGSIPNCNLGLGVSNLCFVFSGRMLEPRCQWGDSWSCQDFCVYFASKVLALLSNHFLNYHHCGAFQSCVCIILMCVCVRVHHYLASEYWIIISKLLNNKFIAITLFKTDGPFYIIYCLYLALNTASIKA